MAKPAAPMGRVASASSPAGSPAHNPPVKVVENPHQLSMRVTTLLKPSLFSSSTLAFENLPEGASFSTDAVSRIESTSTPPNRPFALNYSGVSELLQFTTGSEFYLSDSFTFYLHLSNDSEQIVTNVSVVVAVKDPQNRNKTVLDTSSSPKTELKQQQHSDYIIRFSLPEPGSYVLGIQTQYFMHTGEARSLTKHFKFMVNKPLSVESALITTTQTGYLVRTQVTNLTTSFSILMENVTFETGAEELIAKQLGPSAPSLSQSQSICRIDTKVEDSDGILDLSSTSVLRPGCSIQYLFAVDYVKPESVDPKQISTLGSSTASWRFPMGEPCTSLSSPIFVNNSTRKPFTLLVTNLPGSIKVNQAFTLSLLVHNTSAAPIRPRLVAVKSKMEGVFLTGLTGTLAPKLEPGESHTFSVKAVAVEVGLQSLHGIRITELEKDKIYDINNVLTLHVEA